MTRATRVMVPPRVSIGLPVYQAERFVAQALDALLGQTFDDFELIISDNASTDATEEICRAYASRDSRIHYVRQRVNLGAVPNFNRVFQISHGALFKWAACDDICAPTFLERCVGVLDTDPGVAWCHSRSRHIDADGRALENGDPRGVSYARPSRRLRGATRESAHTHDRFRAVVLGDGGCLDSYGLIRSSVIRETQLYLPNYGSEKVFIAELALHGRFQEIPEILFSARVHAACSANLDSAEAQQNFISTARAQSSGSSRLHLLAGYSRSIHRSGLSVSTKVRCFAVLGHYLLQVSKWQDVIQRSWTSRGVGRQQLERVVSLNGKRNA